MRNLFEQVPELLSGENLKQKMTVLPQYEENIRTKSQTERLVALNDLYNIYIPSSMSYEIYSKLYLSMLRSLQKKEGNLAITQKNINGKMLSKNKSEICQGIIGGADSFTIIGDSGIGKSSAIFKAINLIEKNGIIEIQEPYCKIIPCVVVQCPFDCSSKSLLLEILRQIDVVLETHYYNMAIKSRSTRDLLIGMTSQVLLNHVGILIVDEIQNVVKNKQGTNLISMLTQIINSSGISICMVGTPECIPFFEKVNYLARRSMGLQYEACKFDKYFQEFCEELFKYQYIKKESLLSREEVLWLYEHSAGILALVVTLIHDAQEIAIISGTERLDMNTLIEAYNQRMKLMYGHIKPSISLFKNSPANQNVKSVGKKGTGFIDNDINIIPKEKNANDLDLTVIAKKAREENQNIVELLEGKISILEIKCKK